jgi:sugar diacid utilization regulator
MATYERKRKNDLLNDLIRKESPSKEEVFACKRMLGNRVKECCECYLVVMSSYNGRSRKYWLERRDVYQPLLDSFVDALEDDRTIAWESLNGLGILRFSEETASRGKAQQVKQAEEIMQTILRLDPGFDASIGISGRARSLSELNMCYRQAAVSVQSGKKIWRQRRIFHYHDIGLLQLLPYINDPKQLDNYIERTLDPVLRYDKKKKVKLLPTLESIMLSDNLKSAAGVLMIHYKTLMVRKQRLERLLGVSLDDIDARISLSIAIKLMKLREHKDE